MHSGIVVDDAGLCLNRTNGKDNRVRLRTNSRTIGEDGSKPNPNPNPNPNANPKPKETYKKEKKERTFRIRTTKLQIQPFHVR